MSKKESNPQPPGARPEPPPAPPGILPDNSEVIRTLEARIAELEKVAEAAEATYKIFFWDGTKPLSHWEREYNALRAAGYLGGGG